MSQTATMAQTPSVLYSFRLQLLKLLLLCGIAVALLLWFFETSSARIIPLDRFAYPLITTIFSVACIVLFLRPDLLEQLEAICFTTFAIYIILHAQPAVLVDTGFYTFASLMPWFPLVYTAAFFIHNMRRAIFVSAIVYLSIVIPYSIVAFHSSAFSSAALASDGNLLMLNVLSSHPVYIVTLSGIARLKAHFIQAQTQANALHSAASIDYLTGVANRRAAALLLQQAFDSVIQNSAVVSVILLDIDNFKLVNDTFGHEAGDLVLAEMTTVLQEHLRASDTLGRWGGEEFIVVVNSVDVVEVTQMAERLRAAVEKHTFQQVNQLTASFGVARSLYADTPETLVKRADRALYQAKQHGRNQVVAMN